MIVGLGQDICESKRISNTMERFGARFIQRIFTEEEQQSCSRRLLSSECYARRFAAKEAVSKALGTGFRKGVFWKNISIVNLPGGKPSVVLSGGALECLNQLLPEGFKPEIDISLTDDAGLAYAIVIISANPTSADSK
tara:strand:+ start:1081 stop:1494 length:414 start_codon:yes stop_codon:yes gene_type:complete